MIKKVLSILLSLSIIALCPLTAFAMVATSSDAVKVPVASSNEAEMIQSDNVYIATSSNAFPSQEYMDTDGFDTLDAPALFSSGDASFSNTVNLSSMTVGVYYRDSGNQLRYETFPVDASGHFSTTSFPDFSSVANVRFIFNRGSLPPSGNYNLQFYFGSVTGGFSYSKCNIAITKTYPNTATDSSAVQGVSFTQSSGDISLSTTVNLSSASTLELIFYVSGLQPPYGGDIIAAFTPSNSSPVLNSPSTGNVSDSTNYDVTDAVQQQVEQGETIIELIKNTIQTISSQLTAFWNQLAGEFTNLYSKMTQQHSEQLQADRDNTEDMIAAEESNTTNIINNNNANTDKLAYGYDSSAQDQKNNELGSKLDEYDSAESEIFDSVSGNISDFNMDDYKIEDSSLLAGIVWVSDFMQQLFVSMGLFNLPVTISLVLIFVVIMIGYYRIRS